jgi:hypothetical protein
MPPRLVEYYYLFKSVMKLQVEERAQCHFDALELYSQHFAFFVTYKWAD